MQIALLKAQKEFVATKSPFPAISGGLGCVHPDTRIWTEHGLMRISEITDPVRVLSWNEKNQQFQLSLSGGAFPKGKANLHRVSTSQGEFLATEHHRTFSSGHKYVRVGALTDQTYLARCDSCLLRSIAERGLLSLPSSAQHSSRINVNWMGRYAVAARQRGQQFLSDQGSDLADAPLQGDVRTLSRKSGLFSFLKTDGPAAQILKRTRRGLSYAHSCMQGFFSQEAGPASVWASCSEALSSERTSHYRRLLQLYRETTERHHTVEKSPEREGLHNSEPSHNSCLVDDPILEVSDAERNHVYYDMQVLETNNYIDEYGFIHHNSGKTRAATMRLLTKMLQQPSINTLIGMPTYDLLRLRAMPGVEADLIDIGIPFKLNKSEYSIEVLGYGTMYFRSYDRAERWVAFEVAHTILDELDTLPHDKAETVWRKATERTRQQCGEPNTIGNVTTPDMGIHGFTYRKWVKEAKPGYELIYADTRDNFFLPAGYVEQITANYDPIMAEAYVSGQFMSFNDKKVYHFFDRKRHHTSRTLNEGERIYIGLDFNIGGTCATVWVVENNKPVAVDEFVSHDTHDFVNNLSRYKGHKITVYPDSSGGSNSTNATATDIEIIQKAGYAVDSPNKNPFVRDRINAVNALLSHDGVLINTDKCPELTNAMEMQGYTDKGDPEKFAQHPAIDDWADAMGYFIHRRFPLRTMVAAPRFG